MSPRSAISSPKARLTTLLGPGGAGKTRLATETARTLVGDLPDGAWLVELAAIGAVNGGGAATANGSVKGEGAVTAEAEAGGGEVARGARALGLRTRCSAGI